MFGAIWSLGATSDTESRVKFDVFFRELMRGKVAEHPIPDLLGKTIDAPFPEIGLVYDYFYVVTFFFEA